MPDLNVYAKPRAELVTSPLGLSRRSITPLLSRPDARPRTARELSGDKKR